jgi:zinc transporter 1/2/3
MFSAGIILSLSLVHIVPDSINDLNVIDYPLGGTMILIGVMFLVIIENLSHSILSKDKDDNLIEHNSSTVCDMEHNNQIEHKKSEHNHTCINNLNPSFANNLVAKFDYEAKPEGYIKVPGNKNTSIVILYIFEFACVFHSFIIGLSLGLITDQDNIKKLMVALLFHQMVEGLSLGSMILSSNAQKVKTFIFIASYSLMTPLGISIGLIIDKTSLSRSYDENGNLDQDLNKNWVIIRGCFLGISAGMLIYISLIQIIMEELSKEKLHIKSALLQKTCMYISMLIGASVMCVIALWL